MFCIIMLYYNILTIYSHSMLSLTLISSLTDMI